MDTNIIYLEDCLTGMERLPNGAIDLILCDPPYGITDNKWDKVLNPNRLWEQYLRVIKENGAIVLTAQQPFATDLINKARKYFRYELIWVKSMSGGFLNANRMPLRKHENILVFYKKLPTYNPQKTGEKRDVVIVKPQKGNRCTNYQPTKDYLRHDDGTRHPSSVLHFPNGNRGSLHPTQKPVELFRWLIRTYTNPGEVVLDNCMGSGTTAEACLLEGRRYVGFETNPEYYERSMKRIAAVKEGLPGRL